MRPPAPPVILGVSSLAAVAITVWCLTHGITIVFPHIYYVPIVYAAYRYHHRGIAVSLVLGVIYWSLVALLSPATPEILIAAAVRVVVFVGIGAIVAVLSVRLHTALTSEREHKEHIQRLQKHTREILDMAPVGILRLDRDQRTVYMNGRLRRILGVPEAATPVGLGQVITDIMDGEPAVADVIGRLREGEGVEISFPYTSRYGKEVHLEGRGVPLFHHGEFAGAVIAVEDVAEKRRMQEALRESEEKYRTLVEASSDGIFIVGQDGRFISWNPAFADMCRYGEEDIARMELADILTSASCDITVGQARSLQPGSPVPPPCEVTIVRGDESHLHAEVHIAAVRLASEGDAILGIIRDISLRVEQEKELRVMRTAIGSTPAGIVLADLDLTIISANDAALGMWGYGEERSVVGRPVTDFLAAPEIPPEIAASLRESGHWSGELTGLRADGTEFPVHTVLHAVTDADGMPQAFMAFFIDISEKKKTERELRIKEAAIASSLDAIGLADLDFTIFYVNDAMLEIWGVEHRDEVIGIHIPDMVPSEREMTRDILEALRTTGRWQGEVSFHRRDGARLTVVMSTTRVRDREGTPLCYIASFHDITALKQAEAEIREANKKLNLLTQITRHDILNSVMVADGYLDLARDEAGGETADYLDKMEDAIAEIERQIEFTRDYQAMGETPPRWQDPGPQVQRCLAVNPVPNGVGVTVDLPPVEIFADTMLEKVFCNLVRNAVQHAEGMTRLSITAKEADGDLVIAFTDDGPGIPADLKGAIFKPAYKRRHGHGLFLVSEILDLTGISIAECGTPGEGARFEITVPADGWRRQNREDYTGGDQTP
ncbi:MAG: PAS domain-containing sensor histidine kinase [Methanomicrobiales archaeon]